LQLGETEIHNVGHANNQPSLLLFGPINTKNHPRPQGLHSSFHDPSQAALPNHGVSQQSVVPSATFKARNSTSAHTEGRSNGGAGGCAARVYYPIRYVVTPNAEGRPRAGCTEPSKQARRADTE
jgi:hypothetical protein